MEIESSLVPNYTVKNFCQYCIEFVKFTIISVLRFTYSFLF